jgi:5-methylcytosine-specific restriction endonuclease McrA
MGQLSSSAKDRDAWRCTRCNGKEGLEVHHINGDPSDHRLVNLETLCFACHKDAHRPRRVAA